MSHNLRVDENRVIDEETGMDKGEYTRVQAGYKAAAHNPSLTKETREGAEATLHELEAQHDGKTSASSTSGSKAKSSSSAPSDEYVDEDAPAETGASTSHEDTVHQHRVVGGLKANLHRDDRSEETKQNIRDKLQEMGEEA
ncbi:hypothetical protein JCM8097_008998 [Rhodosporidiobolus ruineniae]